MKDGYIVVENSGMVGEVDVAKFATYRAALAWLERRYTPSERDPLSPWCLFPDVCLDEDGSRRYDL